MAGIRGASFLRFRSRSESCAASRRPTVARPPIRQRPERKKVDPIAVNGEIFVDWPKPDVALVFSGEQNGYLEPCGCAGLENQKGGLKRRFTFLKQLREKGWNVVAMDLGGQETSHGRSSDKKGRLYVRGADEDGLRRGRIRARRAEARRRLDANRDQSRRGDESAHFCQRVARQFQQRLEQALQNR